MTADRAPEAGDRINPVVAKRIRLHPTLKHVVLVAITGYGLEADRQRSQDAGFDHHLVKPADFAKVQKILATVSQNVRPHEALAAI